MMLSKKKSSLIDGSNGNSYAKIGGAEEIRSPDPRLAELVLSQPTSAHNLSQWLVAQESGCGRLLILS